MKGEIRSGLFRLFEDEGNIRFFRIHKCDNEGGWKLREYDKGNLHSEIGTPSESVEEMWPKLQMWQ